MSRCRTLAPSTASSQAWSPIGGITYCRDGNHTSTLDDAVIGAIAAAHGKSPAQAMLRRGLQHNRSDIPKSTKPNRIAENIDIFDFELSADEMGAIDTRTPAVGAAPNPTRSPRRPSVARYQRTEPPAASSFWECPRSLGRAGYGVRGKCRVSTDAV